MSVEQRAFESSRTVPDFEPVAAAATRGRFRRRPRARPRRGRRAVAAALAATAAGLAVGVAAWGGAESGGPAERAGPAGGSRQLVTTPVRVADPAAARLLEPGDVVDVLAASPKRAAARVVARRARVAEVPEPHTGGGDAGEGGLVVLAVPPQTAARLAGAAVRDELAVARWRS